MSDAGGASLLEADPIGALALWDLERATITPATWGLNNRSWFVDDRSGRYVLRSYTSASQAEVSTEHDFLLRLRTAGVPFATPRPLRARDGSTCPLLPASTAVAAVFERIGGEHVDDDDVTAIEAAAFAELDKVLATRLLFPRRVGSRCWPLWDIPCARAAA